MQTAQQLGNPFDAIRDEINTRKEAVNNALNEPAEHLGQYNTSDVTGRASARLEGYRRNSGAMKTYNAAVSCDCTLCLVCFSSYNSRGLGLEASYVCPVHFAALARSKKEAPREKVVLKK